MKHAADAVETLRLRSICNILGCGWVRIDERLVVPKRGAEGAAASTAVSRGSGDGDGAADVDM